MACWNALRLSNQLSGRSGGVLDSHNGHQRKHEFAFDATILAILIPTEAAIGNGFWADELEAAQERILFGHLECPSEDFDGDETLVRTKWPVEVNFLFVWDLAHFLNLSKLDYLGSQCLLL